MNAVLAEEQGAEDAASECDQSSPCRRTSLDPRVRRLEAWPLADTSRMKPADRALFERRYQAVCGYMRGVRLADLTKKWGLSRWEIVRLRNRCLKVHSDGRLWGFRALVPHIHQEDYLVKKQLSARQRKDGCAGILELKLARYPNTRKAVYEHYLRKLPGANESWVPINSSHRVFLESLRKEGAPVDEWPFTADYRGKEALRLHLHDLAKSDMRAFTRAKFGAKAAHALHTGTGVSLPAAVTLPWQRVQFDGHRLNAIITVLVPHPKGGFMERVLHRPWLLLVVDEVTRVILGYHLSFNKDYREEDVLACFRNAIEPSEPRALTIPGLSYHPAGGMHSNMFPPMRWAIWAEIQYDNGKANLSDLVRTQLTSALGCAVNPGQVKTPERRGIAEALFRALEDAHFNRMVNTTGSDKNDPRRKDPEKAAKRYHVTMAHLEELLAVVISNYNGTPHENLCWRSPLEQLRFFVGEEGTPIRCFDVDERSRLKLLGAQFVVTVRGNPKKGRRPYVQFEGERYTSEVLARSPDLIGTQLTLFADIDSIQTITAFFMNGAEFGPLTALGKWRHTPHSLAVRRTANRRKVLRVQHHVAAENVDAVKVLMESLSEEAPTNTKAAAAYEEARRSGNFPSDYHPGRAEATKADFKLPPRPVHKLQSKKRSVVHVL